MSNFHDRLAQLRKSKKMTQKDVAEFLGVNVRTVQYYESGSKRPELDGVIKLAEHFGVSTDYLLGRDDDEDTSDQADNADDVKSTAAEREFLKWVDENLEGTFFYDFAKAPEESKREMMRSLRIIWELEKNRKPGDKQGE